MVAIYPYIDCIVAFDMPKKILQVLQIFNNVDHSDQVLRDDFTLVYNILALSSNVACHSFIAH